MSNKISWTGETWNPIIGCSHASPGCDHCYAERMAARMARNPKAQRGYQAVVTDGRWNGKTALVESALEKPLHWRAPRLVFVGSMTDLFHPATLTLPRGPVPETAHCERSGKSSAGEMGSCWIRTGTYSATRNVELWARRRHGRGRHGLAKGKKRRACVSKIAESETQRG